MTEAGQVERFAAAGRVTGIVGLVVVVGILAIAIIDPGSVPLVVVAGTLVGGLLMWASTVRPQVYVTDGDLVLRNMFDTIRIPLASIDEVAVRQVLVVRVGEQRFVSPAIGRSVRQALKSARASESDDTRPVFGPALGGSSPAQMQEGVPYADFVEHRLRDLIEFDRTNRGIRARSAEAEALGAQVRREPAWPEIIALGLATAFLVVVILL
jgi:hypothetical protein